MGVVYLPSDALLKHLPSHLGVSYLGRGASLHGCPSQVQPLLLTLDEGCLLTAAPPDLERGVAPLGPPAPAQPPPLGRGFALLGRRLDLGIGVAPLGSASAQSVAAIICSERQIWDDESM